MPKNFNWFLLQQLFDEEKKQTEEQEDWRRFRVDGIECDIDPDDYETELEYEEALEEAEEREWDDNFDDDYDIDDDLDGDFDFDDDEDFDDDFDIEE